jgi:hypothetical protein
MRSFRPVFLLLALVLGPGCPLDIQVREPDAGVLSCEKDLDCPEGQRCESSRAQSLCAPGPRITEACEAMECFDFATCLRGRCEYSCFGASACPKGYQCMPDFECVGACGEGEPARPGAYCDSSTDCVRCGACVALNGGDKRCHRPCASDAECGGAPGACVRVPGGGSTQRVCASP